MGDRTISYRQSIGGCLTAAVGARGLSGDALAQLTRRAEAAVERLRADKGGGRLPLLELPGRTDDLDTLAPLAKTLADRGTMLVLGTGGSSLGGQALTALAAGTGKSRALISFADNIDPDAFDDWLSFAERQDAVFLAVSKSGGTAETMAQTLAAWARVTATAGDTAKDRFVAIVQPGDSPLRAFAEAMGIRILDHDPKVGGRFAVLSLVGLLPAMVAGLDAQAVRAGAQAVLDGLWRDGAAAAPALGAMVQIGLAEQCGIAASVMLPYSDRLRPFAQWYCQLWAESLGKGGHGTTPVANVGAVDQHSQLQLWLDGPADKLITLIQSDRTGAGARIEDPLGDPRLGYMNGRTIGDLMAAEQRATAETLTAYGRPVRLIELDSIDERGMGALFMHFMLETILAGYMLDIDPFDQPAVEAGKVLTRKYLSET